MFCKVCGKELKENEKFCTQCGTKVQNEQKKKPEKKEEKKTEKKGMSCLGVGLLTGGVLAVPVLIVLAVVAVIVISMIIIMLVFIGASQEATKVQNDVVNQVIEEKYDEDEYEYDESNDEEYSYQYQEVQTDEDYVLPESEYSYISESDLYGFTEEECRIARNEIYARHGRMFKDAELQAYFNEKSWYTPTIPADAFQESMLNEYEKANKDVILEYERARGWN